MTDIQCSICRGIGRLKFDGQRLPCISCKGKGIDFEKTLAAVRQRESLLKEKLADCEKALAIANEYCDSEQKLMQQRYDAVVELIRSIRLNADPKLFSPGQLAAIDIVLNPPKPLVDECYPRICPGNYFKCLEGE